MERAEQDERKSNKMQGRSAESRLQAMVDGVEAERRRQKRRHREYQFRGEV
jgi:hypothetical protein